MPKYATGLATAAGWWQNSFAAQILRNQSLAIHIRKICEKI